MDFPLYIVLLVYLLGVGFFLVSTFFNLYHIFRFGFFDFTGKLNTFIFISFSIIIFVVTALLLLNTPWLDRVGLTDFLNAQPGGLLDSFLEEEEQVYF